MRRPIVFSVLVIGLALLARSLSAHDAPVAFGTSGGDAWTFEKAIDVQVADPRCDHIAVSSPLATIVASARPVDTRVRVPLKAGENVVEAECRDHGVARGDKARQ